MPRISSGEAKVPGGYLRPWYLWMMVRLVEKPSAPARMPSRTSCTIAWMSAGVASSCVMPRSPIT